MVHHALDVLEHVAAAHLEQVQIALAGTAVGQGPGFQLVDPVLHGGALVFADLVELVQRQACFEQRVPVHKARPGLEQLVLPVIELAREVAAQVQVAIHHQVDDAQHQVGGAGRLPYTGCRAGAALVQIGGGGGQQARGVGIAHGAVGGVHRQQHMVKHGKPHRAGVDAAQHRGAAAPHRCHSRTFRVAWLGGGRQGGQAAKNQQVVLRGVVVARWQLRIEQVRDMQVHHLQAGDGLQRGLDLAQLCAEDGACARHPEKPLAGWLARQRVQLDRATGVDVEDAHAAQFGVKMASGAYWISANSYYFRSKRAASRAK